MLTHPRTQAQIKQYLESPVHAVGISGENGAGKGYVVTFLCAQLLGVNVEAVAAHPYVARLDAVAQKTGIDDVRELQKFLTLTVPGSGSVKRVAILERIDLVGHEAQNALLKTLEEPPTDTVIIVTYARDTDILPTIHSRLRSLTILPVTQTPARLYFQRYEDTEFNRAFLISGGLAGLLSALLENTIDHSLVGAIGQARDLLGMKRHQRLGAVDKSIKNNATTPALLLDGLYRLVDASYRQSLKTKSNNELKTTVARLRLIEEAISDLDQNVQAKLVLGRLFIEL